MWQINRIDNIGIEYKGAHGMITSKYAATAVVRLEYLDDKIGGIIDNQILNTHIQKIIPNEWSMKKITNFMTGMLFEEIDSELDLLNGIV